MKAERLFRAIGLVDEGLIETAAETPVKKRPVWRRYASPVAFAVMGPVRAAVGSITRAVLRTQQYSCPTPGRCCP